MQRPVPTPHGIAARRIARRGWRADYEGVERASGAVALLPAPAGAAPLRDALHGCGCATLCVEAGDAGGLAAMTGRLVAALQWLRRVHRGVPLGVFGAGAGAAAALGAAASRPDLVGVAVALQAGEALDALPLERVWSATLLVVGRDDPLQLAVHRAALPRLHGARRLEIVPGAHDRRDALAAQAVAHLAAQWFAQRLPLRALH